MSGTEIIMTFDADDNPVIEVNGARGKRCKDLTRDLEKVLGTVIATELKPEYKQVETKTAVRQKVGR